MLKRRGFERTSFFDDDKYHILLKKQIKISYNQVERVDSKKRSFCIERKTEQGYPGQV